MLVYVLYVCGASVWMWEGGIVRVADSCWPPHVGAGNQTWSAVRAPSAPTHWIVSLDLPSGFVNIQSRVRDQTKKRKWECS